MSTPLLIALDSGTSVVKAVLFDAEGRELHHAQRPNHPRHLPDGGVEQDMAQTWADAVAVLGEIAAWCTEHDRRGDLAALAVTGQGDGTWLIDAKGEPLHPAFLWLDGRAGELVGALRRDGTSRAVFAHTGSGLNTCQQSSQLLWLKRNAPDVLRRAATAFHCKDWLFFNLTGVRATDPSEACFTFGDWRRRDYADEVLAALGLSGERHLLPPILDGVRETRPLRPEAARAIGLPSGLPVVLGYVDVVCTALGAGIFGAGPAGVSILGSTGMHLKLAAAPEAVTLSPNETGYVMVFPAPPAVMQAETNMAATLNLDWLAGLFADAAALAGASPPPRAEALARLLALAEEGAETVLYHPFISPAGERGPFNEPRARAAFIGFDQRSGWSGLARAVLESLALAARDCYEAMGGAPAEIRLSGGAGKSPLLRRLLAAALERPLRLCRRAEAGAAGAAMIAAAATGLVPDLATATTRWVGPELGPPEPPLPDLASRLDSLYPVYRRSYQALAETWSALALFRKTTRSPHA
jgi:erythritol kinase